MKLFIVVYETDIRTIQGDGVTVTEIDKCEMCYAAETFEDVYEATKWLRDDPEKDFKSISEVRSAVTVLAPKEAS